MICDKGDIEVAAARFVMSESAEFADFGDKNPPPLASVPMVMPTPRTFATIVLVHLSRMLAGASV